MAVDLKELEAQADEFGLEGEDRKNFLSIFQHDKPFEGLKKSVMRQSEFSRRMDTENKALATAREAHEAKMAELTEQLEAVGRLRNDSSAEVARAREESDKILAKAQKAEQALRRVAQDAGLDPDEYMKSIGAEPVAKPVEEKKFDTSNLVDRKSFGQGIRTSVMTTAQLMKVNNAHRKLFGEDLPDPDAMVDYVIEQGAKGRDISIEQAWEERHKVSEKRSEVAAADVDRRIKDAERATEVRVRSEMAIGNPGQNGSQRVESPALALASKTNGGRGQVAEHLLGAAQRIADARAKLATG